MLGLFILSFFSLFIAAFAAPIEVRQETVSNVQCSNEACVLHTPSSVKTSSLTPDDLMPHVISYSALDFHETNVAILSICGGIAGTIEKCEGAPTSTTGTSGGSEFTITPVNKGDTINISKGRWEQGIKAVAAICGADVPFSATFTGGATTGDVNVTLKAV